MDTLVLSSYLDQTSFQTREDRLESDLYSKQQVSRITFFETLLMYRVFFYCSDLKMNKCQPLYENSELFLQKHDQKKKEIEVP